MARCWILLSLPLLACFASAAPALKDPPPKNPPLVGEWLRTGHMQAGKPVGPDGSPHHQVFTEDGKWMYWYGMRPANPTQMDYTADPKKSPATFEISNQRGGAASYRGIYKIDGDTLTLCMVNGAGDLPKTFESSADQPTTIWIFTRVKAKD
jgi:uncharacterized protein (TIGR03067 family)